MTDYSIYGQKYTYEEFKSKRRVDKYDITLPKKPPRSHIFNNRLAPSSQRFPRPDKEMVATVSRKYEDGDNFTEEEEKWLEQQIKYRKEGFWFFNNGYLEYVTGLHWFYLSYWKFPVVRKILDEATGKKRIWKGADLPSFTDSDRDYYYIWDHVVGDDKCAGLVHVTNRRDGKTERGNCTNYELVSRTYDAMSAIQSKTNQDAGAVFRKLIKSWQLLPSFWKPIDTGETNPSASLRFFEPGKRSTKTQKKSYATTLRSEISYYNSKEVALDGLGLRFVMHDECGKTDPKEADVAARWRVVRECIADGSYITGKALLTTTVEEMEKGGGKQLFEVWQGSDPENLSELGETQTGLYRYFKPAFYGLRGEDEYGVEFIDEFGYSDIERTRGWLRKKKAALSGRALADFCRKYPENEGEAFYSASNETFPAMKILQQKNYNATVTRDGLRKGNFIWINPEEKNAARFVDDENGRWIVSWMPEQKERNQRIKTRRGYGPDIKNRGGIGVDPFDHSETAGSRRSNASMHGFLDFNPMQPLWSNMFVFEYLARPERSLTLKEDILKSCTFYGWEALIENQKIGTIEWLNDNDFGGYVGRLDKREYTQATSKKVMDGISTSGNMVREALVEMMYNYIYDHIGKIDPEIAQKMGIAHHDEMHGVMPFERTLDDWKAFDSAKWTQYDATVSSMVTLAFVKGFRNRQGFKMPTDPNDKDDPRIRLFNTY